MVFQRGIFFLIKCPFEHFNYWMLFTDHVQLLDDIYEAGYADTCSLVVAGQKQKSNLGTK